MRDKLIRQYFVNLEMVWVTIKDKLPEFKKQILKILKEIRAKPKAHNEIKRLFLTIVFA